MTDRAKLEQLTTKAEMQNIQYNKNTN